MVDTTGLLIADTAFDEVADAAQGEYSTISLGERYGMVMQDLVQRRIFKRAERIDYQGQCDRIPPSKNVPVSTEGLVMTPAEMDNMQADMGQYPPMSSTYACTTQRVWYELQEDSLVESGGYVQAQVQDGCIGGRYTLAPVNGTNSLLLVLVRAGQRERDKDYMVATPTSQHTMHCIPHSRLSDTMHPDW